MRALDWILDNIYIVLLAAGAIANWLNQRRVAKAEREKVGSDRAPLTRAEELARQEDRRPGGGEREHDLETLERTRRIQEEIRRKIAERGGQRAEPAPASPAEPPRLPPPELHPEATRQRRDQGRSGDLRRPAPAIPAAPTPAEEAVLKRQRQLAEELEALQRRRATPRTEVPPRPDLPRPASASTRARLGAGVAPVAAVAVAVASELRDPAALRRAVILREVLGPPVGLR